MYPTQIIIFMEYPKLVLWGRGLGVPGATGQFFGIPCKYYFQLGARQREKKTFGGSYMERQQQRNANVTLYVRVMCSVFRARYVDVPPV